MSFLTSSKLNSIPNSQSFPFLLNPPLRNDLRLWKRRRLKRRPKLFLLRNQLQPPSSTPSPPPSPFDIFSLLPANWIPPAVVGFASGLALSLSSPRRRRGGGGGEISSSIKSDDVGEWILFTSPTPFNRFVLLRCPSVAFEGGELLENVNDKLVKEERHYVRLDSGRIVQVAEDEERESVEELEYQRVCVATDDGGVISLDWPANLDLSEERGLDTTVLIVPGTPQGSLEESIREFVRECLRRGLFPVVMNPRGCANSPLTTARLFTAADSDDICSAIQFITRARPWSTLTGVGWGYGANMLTKYLAEAGEKTPLIAATCIDNPFDLDEATRRSAYHTSIDKVTGGLIDILRSNKELFQGRRKGFDVEKALAAESIREFETAISMVSYGYESVDDFYADCSTRSVIENLKIPVLFIQNDDGSVPLYSIPRALIAENAFTSLLLCSCVPSDVTVISWYQQVTIEWLTAVELGFLKGRHPLLQDIDVTINPSKGLTLMEGSALDTDRNGRLQRLLNLADVDRSDANVDPVKKMLIDNAAVGANIDLQYNPNSMGSQGGDDHVLTEPNGVFPHSRSVDADSIEDIGSTTEESDTGEVLQTAQVVMKMLDVTMPGTLEEEEKRKVLNAVGQGETLIKALQDAVPEDVRGKLTTSVSEILQAQGKNLKLDGLLSINQIANLSSGLKSEIKEKVSAQSNTKKEINDQPSDDKIAENHSRNKIINNRTDVDVSGGESPGARPPNFSDIPDSGSVSSHSDHAPLDKGSIDSQYGDDKSDRNVFDKKVGQQVEDDGSGATANQNSSSPISGRANSLDADVVQKSSSEDDNTKQQDTGMPTQVENPKDLLHEQDTSSGADSQPDDTKVSASPISEGEMSEKGDTNSENKDETTMQPPPNQNGVSDAKSPSFNVTQALDALTGLDDSTQVAVNSVFGVIEDMITQLEEKQNEENKKGIESNDASNDSVLGKNHITSELRSESQSNEKGQEDRSLPYSGLVNENDNDNKVKAASNDLVAIAKDANKHAKTGKSPSELASDPLTQALHKEYIRKYILSKLQNLKSFDLDATAGIYLHYVPEEGHWILLEKPKCINDAQSYNSKDRMNNPKMVVDENNIIEPSYVILNEDRQKETTEELDSKEKLNYKLVNPESSLDNSISSVKTAVLDCLNVEVSRRLSETDMKDMEAHLAADMQKVAEAIHLAIKYDEEQNQHASVTGVDDEDLASRLNRNQVVEAISKAVQDTSYLKRVLPVGVVVGSSLAALSNCCDGAAPVDSDLTKIMDLDKKINKLSEAKDQLQQMDDAQASFKGIICEPFVEMDPGKEEEIVKLNSADELNGSMAQSKLLDRDNLIMGAVTAALGASAFLTTQQGTFTGSESFDAPSNLEERLMKKESSKLEETGDSNHQGNIVTSLAEKAMSVAAPVVPKKDGEVDHDRIVSMLTELGQRGGVLRLVAKLALLWGGLRGAISLTDRLISFLRVAERPLLQRVLGFSCMVVVLWSPVLVPLLPTLFHNMATHRSSTIAELACIVGLYAAITILIMQWGKRLRGYDYPLKQYGLDLMSSRKIQDFLTGLVGGAMLVLTVHSVNALLGFVSFSVPTNLSSSALDLAAKLQAYGQLFLLAGRGLLMVAGVAFVEELLFRSWLLEEVAADHGYHLGILVSGFAFSLSQRSIPAIPGLLFLSVCLAGARLRKKGSLFLPTGMRTGIMSSSFLLQTGGFLIYHPRSQFWVAGMHPLQPFTGLVGVLIVLLLAVALYPRQPGLQGRAPRAIRT